MSCQQFSATFNASGHATYHTLCFMLLAIQLNQVCLTCSLLKIKIPCSLIISSISCKEITAEPILVASISVYIVCNSNRNKCYYSLEFQRLNLQVNIQWNDLYLIGFTLSMDSIKELNGISNSVRNTVFSSMALFLQQ